MEIELHPRVRVIATASRHEGRELCDSYLSLAGGDVSSGDARKYSEAIIRAIEATPRIEAAALAELKLLPPTAEGGGS